MERCWILLGMMGAGKSAVGRSMAELSGRRFLDTDQLLQHKLGRPIHQLFGVYGEEAFRAHETAVLRGLMPDACVLATGGGIVVREENWAEMRRLGTTILLRVEHEALSARLERSKRRRPLLEVVDWEKQLSTLMEFRKHLYVLADLSVDVSVVDVREAAVRVLAAIERFESGISGKGSA